MLTSKSFWPLLWKFVHPNLRPFAPKQSLLEEQLSQVQENEVVRLRMVQMSNVPDMVQYMVEERGYPGHRHATQATAQTSTAASVDIIAGTIPGRFCWLIGNCTVEIMRVVICVTIIYNLKCYKDITYFIKKSSIKQ